MPDTESTIGAAHREVYSRTLPAVHTPVRLRANDAALLAILVAIAAALRFYRLDSPLWYDEIVTLVEFVRAPLRDIVTRFPGDNHHPLYSLLSHLSIAAFGEQAWALRLPSVLFGIAAIPMLYVLGLNVTNRLEAGAAALILSVSYHHVWFSQNARGYTMLLFFVLLSTFALLRWFATVRRAFLVLYAISTALGAYAHLTMVLIAVGQALVCVPRWPAHAAQPGGRSRLVTAAGAFAGAGLLTALLYAPMLPDVGSVLSSGAPSDGTNAQLSWTAGAVLQGLRTAIGNLWAIAIGGIVFIAGIWSGFRRDRRATLLFVVPVFVTIAAALILNRPVRPRFVFFAAGFALLFTVRGAGALGASAGRILLRQASPSRVASASVMLLTAGAVVFSLRSLPYGYRPKQDYIEAVTFVDRSKHPEDRVAVIGDGGAIPIVNYLRRPWQRIDSAEELRALGRAGRPVWVVSTFESYIQRGQPDLWAMLQNECSTIHSVEATVADADIMVRRCP